MSILFLNGGAIISNKKLIVILGHDATLVLGEIYSEHLYFKGKGETEDGCFFSTVRNLQKNTGLSKYKQKKAFDKLEKYGLIQTKRAGVFGRRHIKFNEDMLRKIICDDKYLTSQKILPVEVKLFAHSINKNNTNKNNKNISKKETRVREEDLRAEFKKKLEKQRLEFEKKLKEQKECMDKNKMAYEELISKLLRDIEEQEKEEEIKKNPIDFYDVGDKIHSSYSENYENKGSKTPGAGVENDNEELEYSSDSNTGRITTKIDDFNGDVVKLYQEVEKGAKNPLKFKNSKNDTSEQKKFYNRPTFNQLIEGYTNNEELRFELKQHLKVRKIKGVLCNYSIELGFRTLDACAKSDREKILMVRNANEGGWTKFYGLPKWQQPTGFEASYNLGEYQNNYI